MKESDLMVVGKINTYGNSRISIEKEVNLHRIIKKLMIQNCIRTIECSLVPDNFEFEEEKGIYSHSINMLDITDRCKNRLRRAGIYKVGQLLKTEWEIRFLFGIGKKSLIEIKRALSNHGLIFKKEPV